jgi:Uncharacterized protein conserved in bacteria
MDSLYINLFMSNHAHVSIHGTQIELIQQTGYPWNGQINIAVNPEKRTAFTIKLRIPEWAQNKAVPGNLYTYIGENSEKVILRINGKDEKHGINKGYIEITKEWIKGDKIELILPMTIRRVIANEKVQDDNDKVAFEYGPIVYCAEEIDNDNQLSNLSIPDNAKLRIEKQNILSNSVNIIAGNVYVKSSKAGKKGYNLTLVPYYLWSNRGIGKMKVWFPREIE